MQILQLFKNNGIILLQTSKKYENLCKMSQFLENNIVSISPSHLDNYSKVENVFVSANHTEIFSEKGV